MSQDIIRIYCHKKYCKLLFYILLKKKYHFSLVLPCPGTTSLPAASFTVRSITALLLFLITGRLRATPPLAQAKTNMVCFIAIKSKSYSFKRLWVFEKAIRASIPKNYFLVQSIFLEKINKTSNVIHIYQHASTLRQNQSVALHLLPSGFGDVFRHAYIIQKFIADNQMRGMRTTLIHSNPSSFQLSKLLFKNCDNRVLPDRFSNKILEHTNYTIFKKNCQVADLDYLAKTRAYDLSNYLLGYFYQDLTKIQLDLSYTSKKSIRRLERLRKKSYIVGVQFNTAHDNKKYERNYPQDLAKQFVQLCKNADIAVVNLTSGYKIHADFEAGHEDITGVPGIINRVDIVVTIDSFSGHLAACLNKPSIILYKCVYSFTMSVLRNNYNLVSGKNDMRSITPKAIFTIMMKLLNHELTLPQNVKKQYDIRKEPNTIII